MGSSFPPPGEGFWNAGSGLMGLVSPRFLPLTSDVALVFRYLAQVGD